MKQCVLTHRISGGRMARDVEEYWLNTGEGWKVVSQDETTDWKIGDTYRC